MYILSIWVIEIIKINIYVYILWIIYRGNDLPLMHILQNGQWILEWLFNYIHRKSSCLTIYIEKAVVKEFSLESIINDINVMKSVRHNF